MTVCSVPVQHNTTASNAIQNQTENDHALRYILINENEPA